MNTQQLIEMAVLDALALLDDEEREDFERSFRGASPDVQAHVRREQTRLCNIESILPNVEPPAGLRAAVLAAVRDEIALERDHAVAGRIARGGVALQLLPVRRVSPLWRAAAVGLATASVVFGVTTLWMKGEFRKLETTIAAFDTNASIDNALGQEAALLVRDASVPKFALQPVSASFPGSGSLFLDNERGKGVLFCNQLPTQEEGRTYKIMLVDGDGGETLLETFDADGTDKTIELTIQVKAGDSIVITGVSEGSDAPEPMLATGALSL
jgi:hypothetical protein